METLLRFGESSAPAIERKAGIVEIHVNDETREVPDSISLLQLISNLNLGPERIAIEVNHDVVRRAHWPSTVLKEGDRVEIVHFVGGGGQEARRQEQRREAGRSHQDAVSRTQ